MYCIEDRRERVTQREIQGQAENPFHITPKDGVLYVIDYYCIVKRLRMSSVTLKFWGVIVL